MGAVVRLPTAAAKRVAQPTGVRARRAAREQAVEAGVYAKLPVEFLPPQYRAILAQEAARSAELRGLFERGGFDRSGPQILMATILYALPQEQQHSVLQRLETLHVLTDSDEARAALAYAKAALGHEVTSTTDGA